jgi:DNA-directed RNA polymerase subunit beta'
MSSLNVFSPSSGKPIMTPTQTFHGCYYLTGAENPKKQGQRLVIRSKEEVVFAYQEGALRIHDSILIANQIVIERLLRDANLKL